jgi:hypothetical protein
LILAATAAAALSAFAPVVLHDSDERSPLSGVDGAPAVYGRAVEARAGGTWLQYWLYYSYQDQDRGIVRTGRHEGDWELVQYRISGERLVEAVYAQHSGAERCEVGAVSRRGDRPVVYAAHGSHASYFRAGTRDRMWPDPNDEADGRGRAVAGRLVEITARSPAWMSDPEPWGDSRARWWVPPEQSSPPGPAFQPDRWNPETFAAGARDCQAGCDDVGKCDAPEKALTVLPLVLLLVLAVYRIRTRTRLE